MSAIQTLQFGTYTFPNMTFQIEGHKLTPDTPVVAVRRVDGGEVLPGYLTPRTFVIRGKVFGTNKDSVHNEFITLQRAIHNAGNGASLFYRSDRYVYASLSQSGINGVYAQGLYEYLIDVDLMMVARRAYAEGVVVNSTTGSRTNSCGTLAITPNGNYPTQGVWTLVAGTWGFTGGINIVNLLNSHSFSYTGPMIAGQTLIIDNAAGSVLLQVGLTMVDAISHFGGDLFMSIKDGVENSIQVCAPTLAYTFQFRDRYFS